jgi:hypothetical protein
MKIQILETMHSGVSYWLVFENLEIIGKYNTRSEALKAVQERYPKLDGVMVTPI